MQVIREICLYGQADVFPQTLHFLFRWVVDVIIFLRLACCPLSLPSCRVEEHDLLYNHMLVMPCKIADNGGCLKFIYFLP